MELNELCKVAHQAAVDSGWWKPGTEKTALECHMLIVSEVAEATEEVRGGRPPVHVVNKHDGSIASIDVPSPESFILTDGDQRIQLKPEGEAVELADAVIRIADWFGRHGWDLEAIVKAKMAYNATRGHRHASETSVPADRSRAEIEKTITRYGADGFMYMTRGDSAIIGFEHKLRAIKIKMNLPPRSDFTRNKAGSRVSETQAENSYQQALRQRWRALALVVKAKLEAVASGVSTFEEEFLPYFVLKGGRTVGDELLPKLQAWSEGGKMPPLMLGPGEGS